MAFEVFMDAPALPLSNADVKFVVREDGEKIGELQISKGAVEWFPRGAAEGYNIAWKKLGELIVANGQLGAKR